MVIPLSIDHSSNIAKALGASSTSSGGGSGKDSSSMLLLLRRFMLNNNNRRNSMIVILMILAMVLLVIYTFGGGGAVEQAVMELEEEVYDKYKDPKYMFKVNTSSMIITNDSGTKKNAFDNVVGGSNKFANLQHYHCSGWSESASTSNNKNIKQIVLLHSVHFEKENWKQSGILDILCSSNDGQIMVTAIDLPTIYNQGYNDLINLLYEMQQQNLIFNTPITTIVTPYGSAKMIIDFLKQQGGNTNVQHHLMLKRYIKSWVTIASYHVLNSINDYRLSKLKHAEIPVLAVHCDHDYEGKSTSERLKNVLVGDSTGIDNNNNTTSPCTVVEIEGGHSCYLDDNPEQFAKALLDFIQTIPP